MSKTPRLARPCSLRGTDFERRDDGTLFCSSCQEVVHDLTRATRSEASRLYRANGGKLCGLVRVRPSGELRFAPERPRRGLFGAASGAALVLALAACDDEEATSNPPTPVVAPEAAATLEPVEPADPVVQPVEPPKPDPVEPTAEGDTSPHQDVHATHRHRHDPVLVDDQMLPGGLDGL